MLAMVAWLLLEMVLVVALGAKSSDCVDRRRGMARDLMLRRRQDWQVNIELFARPEDGVDVGVTNCSHY
jgi:hypothetical protein